MNFRSYGSYLTEKYGKRAYRVGVDAGFSCPNRENGRGGFGCAFCDEAGSRAAYIRNDNGSYPESDAFKPCGLPGYPPGYSAEAVRSQIDRGIAFLRRRYRAEVFLLYFQAYSGTYAPPEILKRIYDDALAAASFSELIVSTRPDCLDGEKADLLASYRRPDFDVWCETGLQTVHDKTLLAVRRGTPHANIVYFTDFVFYNPYAYRKLSFARTVVTKTCLRHSRFCCESIYFTLIGLPQRAVCRGSALCA